MCYACLDLLNCAIREVRLVECDPKLAFTKTAAEDGKIRNQ